eukprot:788004-Rhodomonas_salina.1
MAMPELDHSWLSKLREWGTKSPQLHSGSFLCEVTRVKRHQVHVMIRWGLHSQGERTEEGSAVQSWDRPRGHVIPGPHLPEKGGPL